MSLSQFCQIKWERARDLRRQGKLEEAAQYYRRSLEEKPTAAVQNALAGVLRRLGETDRAP